MSGDDLDTCNCFSNFSKAVYHNFRNLGFGGLFKIPLRIYAHLYPCVLPHPPSIPKNTKDLKKK